VNSGRRPKENMKMKEERSCPHGGGCGGGADGGVVLAQTVVLFFFPAFSLSSISVLASSLFVLPFYSLFCFYFSSIYQQCSTLSVVAPWRCCYSRWFTVVASQWQMTVRDGFSPVHFCHSCYSPAFLSLFFSCFCALFLV